jgi:hypothetical protein
MTRRAAGEFDVKLAPMAPDDGAGDSPIGRMSIDKRFHGELDGSSRGQMLAFRSAVDGSAGYVAMERVEGSLFGRSGSFVLQHSATMTRGEPSLSIVVVPDSGAGELAGLAGTMKIVIEAKKHFYEFDVSLPDPS